jgi:hypothetical protein
LISVDSTSILAHQHFAGARFHDHPGTRPNDKYALTCLCGVTLAAIMIHHRVRH